MFRNEYNLNKNNFDEIGIDISKIIKNYDFFADGDEKLKILCNFLTDNNKEIVYYIVANTR